MSADGGKPFCNDLRVKTVVFDLGGVLFTEGKSVAIEALHREHGYDPEIIHNLLTSRPSRNVRKGLLSEETFWSWVASYVPQGYDAQVIRDEWYRGYVLDADICKLVRKLQGRYRLVVFSENIPERVAYLDELYGFRELFDEEIYSYDHHLGKRDPEFVETLLTTLGEQPAEIVYLNNCKTPLEIAARLGVKVVHYTTGRKEAIEEVERYLQTSAGTDALLDARLADGDLLDLAPFPASG